MVAVLVGTKTSPRGERGNVRGAGVRVCPPLLESCRARRQPTVHADVTTAVHSFARAAASSVVTTQEEVDKIV